jgi:heavy metal sensor kinase
MNAFSIRTRLALWYTAVLAGSLLLFGCTVWFTLRHLLLTDLSTSLQHQMQGLRQYMQVEDGGDKRKLAHEIDEYADYLGPDDLLITRAPDGSVLYANRAAQKSGVVHSLSGMARGGSSGIAVLAGKRYLWLRSAAQLEAGSSPILLALSADAAFRTIRLLEWILMGSAPLFLLGAAAGGYWLSRRALAPVDRITEQARVIGVENLSERLPVPHTKDELQRLTSAWNEMLARLEVAVSRISQFTADASHELRTPVAVIRLAAEQALRKSRSGAEYREALLKIQHQSENMTRLIENLLFLARTGPEKPPTAKEMLELAPLVRDVCQDFEPLAAAKDLEVRFVEPREPVPEVYGTASGIRQVLTVLLDNAVKFTPPGGRVAISIEPGDSLVVVAVDDTGIGIPEQARPHIFERFFQVEPSRNKQTGGFGLGLAVARRVAEQNWASIEFETKPAGGCRFSIRLAAAA